MSALRPAPRGGRDDPTRPSVLANEVPAFFFLSLCVLFFFFFSLLAGSRRPSEVRWRNRALCVVGKAERGAFLRNCSSLVAPTWPQHGRRRCQWRCRLTDTWKQKEMVRKLWIKGCTNYFDWYCKYYICHIRGNDHFHIIIVRLLQESAPNKDVYLSLQNKTWQPGYLSQYLSLSTKLVKLGLRHFWFFHQNVLLFVIFLLKMAAALHVVNNRKAHGVHEMKKSQILLN